MPPAQRTPAADRSTIGDASYSDRFLEHADLKAMTPLHVGPDRARLLLLLAPERPPAPGDQVLADTPWGTVTWRASDGDMAGTAHTAARRDDVITVVCLSSRGTRAGVVGLALCAGHRLAYDAHRAECEPYVPIMGVVPSTDEHPVSHLPHFLTVRSPTDSLTDHVVWRTMTDEQREREFGAARSGPLTRVLAEMAKTLPWARALARERRLDRYSSHAEQVYAHLAGAALNVRHVLERPQLYAAVCADLDLAAPPMPTRMFDTGP
ncbi:hypothetical protein [Embleya sp. MST-111070]|uniref:hypothetical protein n=1 Tax=Embleya sp. MST-111070 TaxID=3398231 RepID=UPI003F737121